MGDNPDEEAAIERAKQVTGWYEQQTEVDVDEEPQPQLDGPARLMAYACAGLFTVGCLAAAIKLIQWVM